MMKDQYENTLETISEEISHEGTGKYYTEALVPETDSISWDVYAEHDFEGFGTLNATSSMYGTVPVESANITINTTATKENDEVFENTQISLFKRGDTANHKIFDDFFNTTSRWIGKSVLKEEKYDIEFSMPDNNKLNIIGLNTGTSDRQVKAHSSELSGDEPSDFTSFSKILASDASDFDTATLYYSISYTPDSICNCEGWNYTTNDCTTLWQCNSTEDYPHDSNMTHFWFNTTHFTGYAVGSEGKTNLTIWDENSQDDKDPLYQGGEEIKFYANYTWEDSYIENSNCSITLWSGDTYNMTDPSSFGSSVFNYTSSTPNPEYDKIYDWNVTCINTDGYENLTARDEFEVSGESQTEEIPEYDIFGLVMIIIFVMLGYYIIQSYKRT